MLYISSPSRASPASLAWSRVQPTTMTKLTKKSAAPPFMAGMPPEVVLLNTIGLRGQSDGIWGRKIGDIMASGVGYFRPMEANNAKLHLLIMKLLKSNLIRQYASGQL